MTSHRALRRFALCSALFLVACGGPPPTGGDSTPPSLTSASPVDGTVDVALSAALVLTFDEPIGSLLVTPSPLVGLAEPQWDEAGQVATIAPSPAWPVGTSLSFAIRAEDEHGNAATINLGFTTLDDQDPPAAPAGLLATRLDGAIALSWTANAEADLASYLLFWGEDAAAPTGAVAVPAGTTQFTVSPLENGTSYQFYLVAEDEAGNQSSPSTTVSAAPGDTTPPVLLSSLPSDGVSGVGLVELVRFVFSEPLDTASLHLFLYEVQAPAEGDPINPDAPVVQTLDVAGLGAPAWNAEGTLVQYDDVAPDLFGSDKAYRFQLQAEDLAGNLLPSPTVVSFLAGLVPDVIPPTVGGLHSVVDQELGRGVFTFYFSEPMDQPATQAAFNSAPPLNCIWAWPSASEGTCTVNSGLLQQQDYAVQFTTGARDVMGNALEAVWNAAFTTLNFSPRLTGYTPVSGFGGLPPRIANPLQPITWTFSEPVRLDDIAGEIRSSGGALFDIITQADVSLSVEGLTITYYPPAAYNCLGTIYTWTLTRVYEQSSGGGPLRHTPSSYAGSFQCGEVGVGGFLLPYARGE